MTRRWRWIGLAALPVAAASVFFFWKTQPLEVEIAAARRGPALELVYATGFLEPQQPVSVAARVTAPVADILVREGERVTQGQALVRLADDEQRAAIAQAQAERIKTARDEARIVALYRQGWVTRAARDQAVAAADATRAAERIALARSGQYVLRAGISGIVLKRDVEPGDLATPARTLMTLGDPARVRITATVDERDVPRVRAGQAALMSTEAFPGRIMRARVREVTPGGDPAQRAFRVRLALEDAPPLPLGLTLEVNIVTRRVESAVLVPATALSGNRLWVVNEGRAQARTVRTGISGADRVQIVSGVRPGEYVIINPPDGLEDSERVRVGNGG